jgi:hypothetical protein
MARPAQGCLESMWDDGKCDPECNNVACGFNDCSPAQTAAQCVVAQQAEGLDTSTPPTNASVSMHLQFDKPRLALDKDLNQMVYSAEITYTLSWSDSRLPPSPCFDVIDFILSRRVGEPKGQRGVFWVPDPLAVNGIRDANIDRDTSIVTSTRQAVFNSTSTRKQEFEQQFQFLFYPFDDQIVRIDLSVPGAKLDCVAIAASLNNVPSDNIVPTSSPWNLLAPIRAAPPANGELGRCLLEVPIVRNYVVYVVQRLIPLMLIGGGALMALFINPTAAPAPGARMGILLSTMVLISLKSNSDLGLGTLTYLIWIDYMKLCQFMILLSAVFETALVHHVSGKGNIPKALMIDRTARLVLPFVLYPWIIGCMLIIGSQRIALGLSIFATGFVLIVFYGLRKVNKARLQRLAKRRKVADTLVNADLSDDSSIPVLEEAFKFFDLDNSGAIDAQELHTLMALVYPKMNRLQISREIKTMDLKMPVIFEDFAEALQTLQQRVKVAPGGRNSKAAVATTVLPAAAPLPAMRDVDEKSGLLEAEQQRDALEA